MRLIYAFLCVYTSLLHFTLGLQGLSHTNCGFIDKRIFCFGGTEDLESQSRVNSVNKKSTNKLYSLDLKNLTKSDGTFTSLEEISQQWIEVVPTNWENYIVESRAKACSVTYGDNALMIYGGSTLNGSRTLTNQTIEYNASTNSWRTLPNYYRAPNKTAQIFDTTCVYHPTFQTILVYGGATLIPNKHIHNVLNHTAHVNTTLDSDISFVNNAGFLVINKLDPKKDPLWSILSPQQDALDLDSYSGQTATLNPTTGLIYYLGGYFMTSGDGYQKALLKSYNYVSVFDTYNGIWNNITLGGPRIPSRRISPSATLLPNSDDILLFGGGSEADTNTVTDICYTLNLNQNNWTFHALTPAEGINPSRYGHSAVLVDTSLFILFGRSFDSVALNDMLVLDVASVSNITIEKTYPYVKKAVAKSVSLAVKEDFDRDDDDNDDDYHTQPLSTGAIVGISISCAITVLGIIGSILVFRLKKQKAAAKAEELVLAREVKHDNQDQESEVQEEMHVDWDKIDSQFGDNKNIQYHLSPALEIPSVRTYPPNSHEHVPHSRHTPDVKLSFLPSDSSRAKLGDQYTTATSSSLSNNVTLIKPDIGEGA